MALVRCSDCNKPFSNASPSCIHCGRPNSTANHSRQSRPASGNAAGFGWFLLLVGLGGGVYTLTLDPSVSVWGVGRVVNLGMMNDKQNYLIASGICAVIGAILVATSKPIANT